MERNNKKNQEIKITETEQGKKENRLNIYISFGGSF
jgi:hypothetical protein